MSKWNQATERFVYRVTAGIRKRRNDLLLRLIAPRPNDMVLDPGSEDGSQIATFYPFEAHALLPFVGHLPAKRQLRLSELLKHVWIKEWDGYVRLLSHRDMVELFPEATIVPERFFGLIKSWMAVKRAPDDRPGSSR